MSTAAAYVLRRMQQDGRLAYLIGPGSQAYELLTQEAAKAAGRDVAEFRQDFDSTLKTERWPSANDEAASPAVVLDPELAERIRIYDDQVHDMSTTEDLSFLVNHFLAIGLKHAEAERDTQTESLF